MERERKISLKERRDNILDLMKEAGMRLTNVRREMLTLLFEEEAYALSTEEIHSRFTESSPDLVTVYRNIESLIKIGVLDCLADSKGPSRYRLVESNGTKLKISCRDCHSTAVDSSPMLSQLENVARELGYHKLQANLEITGYCEDCSEKHSED
tara:strand:- start:1311 stop:1772 length:462 start_codon:yes stop_codon:yes gene_type:complete